MSSYLKQVCLPVTEKRIIHLETHTHTHTHTRGGNSQGGLSIKTPTPLPTVSLPHKHTRTQDLAQGSNLSSAITSCPAANQGPAPISLANHLSPESPAGQELQTIFPAGGYASPDIRTVRPSISNIFISPLLPRCCGQAYLCRVYLFVSLLHCPSCKAGFASDDPVFNIFFYWVSTLLIPLARGKCLMLN